MASAASYLWDNPRQRTSKGFGCAAQISITTFPNRTQWLAAARKLGVNRELQRSRALVRRSLRTGQDFTVGADTTEPVNATHMRRDVRAAQRQIAQDLHDRTVPLITGWFGAYPAHVVHLGIGANQEFAEAASRASNVDPGRQACWTVIHTPGQLPVKGRRLGGVFEPYPSDAHAENTLGVVLCRSARTGETTATTQFAAMQDMVARATTDPLITKWLALVNQPQADEEGPLYDVMQELQRRGQKVEFMELASTVPGRLMRAKLASTVPGRLMRAKTGMLSVPMGLAASPEFNATYWAKTAALDEQTFPKVNTNCDAVSDFTRFLATVRATRKALANIYLATNDPILWHQANASIQLWDEAGGKPGAEDISMFQGVGFPREAHFMIEILFQQMKIGRALPIFLINTHIPAEEPVMTNAPDSRYNGLRPSEMELLLTMANVVNAAKLGPAMLLEVDCDWHNISQAAQTLSALDFLFENAIWNYFVYRAANPGSNPMVRDVRNTSGALMSMGPTVLAGRRGPSLVDAVIRATRK